MSIKHGLLALLGERPRHGYQLKTAFEARTGGTWPLNIGQVYTTLQRLERDGLVAAAAPAADGTVTYSLTDAGRTDVAGWWSSTVERHPPPRDELAIKIALALGATGVEVGELVRAQRVRTVRTLQWLTRLRAELETPPAADRPASDGTGPYPDRATALILDRLIFEADAEARWLDHVERGHPAAPAGALAAQPSPTAPRSTEPPVTEPTTTEPTTAEPDTAATTEGTRA
jgi:DNA-binding PadR family transcriptional regulator